MEGLKPASSATSSAFSSAASSSSTSSSSLVAELFGKPASQTTSSGGIFDSIFSAPNYRGVRREYVATDGQAWKNEQSENKTWQHKKTSPDGSLANAERDCRNVPNKNLSSPSNEVVEHPLSSSVHYGGRDDYIEPAPAEKYFRRTNIFEKNSGEDVSDGGSPRGNFWSGSFYY